jgi:hypothetical protein
VKLKIHPAWGLLLGLALLPLMPTNQSLWLDEGDTAAYALQPDFSSWHQHLNQDVAADCQMPLAMFCAWVTGQTLGTQEWQLRVINVFWGALALLGMYRAGKKIQLPWLPLLLAIQPYFWFYSNEARPYALQIACGAWLFAGFAEYIALKGAGESWAWLVSIAAFFLCLATLLGALPIIVVMLVGGAIAKMCRWKISRKAVLILLGGATANIPVALYYVSTLARGAKGAQLWHVDLKFFGYVIYEFTGMTGLGLAIEKIREIARAPHLYATLIQHAFQFILPMTCLLLLVLTLAVGLRRWRANSQAALTAGIIGVFGIISFVFIVVGICIQKAFWARHLAPIFPFYVALLGIAISSVREDRNRFAKILPCLLIGLLFFSALNLRFAARHRKEDYRSAAQIARRALDEKKSVWWVAGVLPAQYYYLDCALAGPEPGKVFCPQSGEIQNLPTPDVIIFSKPDIFDDRGVIQDLIKQNNYHPAKTLKSFVIWTK